MSKNIPDADTIIIISSSRHQMAMEEYRSLAASTEELDLSIKYSRNLQWKRTVLAAAKIRRKDAERILSAAPSSS